jgi:hypothetical protein
MGRVFAMAVAGESFANRDGTSRQEEIRRCTIGEPVQLEREPDNPYDRNCVRVLSSRGIQIGNIPRDEAEWLAEHLDSGEHCAAVVLDGGQADGGLFGICLLVSTDPEAPPDVKQFREREEWEES